MDRLASLPGRDRLLLVVSGAKRRLYYLANWVPWRYTVGILLLFGFGFALIGQYCYSGFQVLLQGFVFTLIGALFLLLAVYTAAWGHAREDKAGYKRHKAIGVTALVRACLVVLSLLASVMTLLIIPSKPSSYLAPFLLWTFSTVAFCAATAPCPSRGFWNRVRVRMLEEKVEILGIAFLLAAAFALRVWKIDSIPPIIGGDEGSQGTWAMYVLAGKVQNPFDTGWLSVPTMSFFYQAIWLKLLGANALGLRFPWALVGAATVLTTYLLVRRLSGRRLALLVAILLAGYDYHIHFSRLGSNQIADGLFLSASLYFLVRGVQDRRILDFVLCGVVIGLSQYFYAGARLALVVVFLTLVYFLWRQRDLWRTGKLGLGVLALSTLLVAAPMIQYAFAHPDDYNGRLNQTGVFQSGWLWKEEEIRHEGPLPILWDQFQRAALAFTSYPDRTVWYGNPKPLLQFPASFLFTLGLAYAMVSALVCVLRRKSKDSHLFPFVAWYWSGIILGGMLTESPPSSQRLIGMAPVAMIFVALAIYCLVTLVQQIWGVRRSLTPAAALLALMFAGLSTKYYFVDFTPLRLYGGDNSWVATDVGYYLRQAGPDNRVYFFGPPRMYIGFGTILYLAPQVEGKDVLKPISGPPDFVESDKNAIFLFLPERLPELAWVRQAYPNGTLRAFPGRKPNESLFEVYEVSRSDLLTRKIPPPAVTPLAVMPPPPPEPGPYSVPNNPSSVPVPSNPYPGPGAAYP